MTLINTLKGSMENVDSVQDQNGRFSREMEPIAKPNGNTRNEEQSKQR